MNYHSIVVQMHRLEIFTFAKYCDLEIHVRGHPRSFEIVPFDRSHVTSYSHYIVTFALACTVSET